MEEIINVNSQSNTTVEATVYTSGNWNVSYTHSTFPTAQSTTFLRLERHSNWDYNYQHWYTANGYQQGTTKYLYDTFIKDGRYDGHISFMDENTFDGTLVSSEMYGTFGTNYTLDITAYSSIHLNDVSAMNHSTGYQTVKSAVPVEVSWDKYALSYDTRSYKYAEKESFDTVNKSSISDDVTYISNGTMYKFNHYGLGAWAFFTKTYSTIIPFNNVRFYEYDNTSETSYNDYSLTLTTTFSGSTAISNVIQPEDLPSFLSQVDTVLYQTMTKSSTSTSSSFTENFTTYTSFGKIESRFHRYTNTTLSQYSSFYSETYLKSVENSDFEVIESISSSYSQYDLDGFSDSSWTVSDTISTYSVSSGRYYFEPTVSYYSYLYTTYEGEEITGTDGLIYSWIGWDGDTSVSEGEYMAVSTEANSVSESYTTIMSVETNTISRQSSNAVVSEASTFATVSVTTSTVNTYKTTSSYNGTSFYSSKNEYFWNVTTSSSEYETVESSTTYTIRITPLYTVSNGIYVSKPYLENQFKNFYTYAIPKSETETFELDYVSNYSVTEE